MAILGIDEVGRGPLAGPLVVGAVILPREEDGGYPDWVGQLRDSKKLSARKREAMREMIVEKAVAWALAWVKIEELNEVGIAQGMRLAVRRVVQEIQAQKREFSEIIIDGNVNYLAGTTLAQYTTTVVKGDDLIKEISAASIVAKCTRDDYMKKLAERYPQYGFEKHMGYGTKQHLLAIREHGICEEHRLFCAPVARVAGMTNLTMDRKVKNTTQIGVQGEGKVCEYLTAKNGHRILVRNFKTQSCEIDVISVRGNELFFTEVKTRKDGGGLLAVDMKKRRKMRRAVEIFLSRYREYRAYDMRLAVAAVNSDFEVTDWFLLDAFDV